MHLQEKFLKINNFRFLTFFSTNFENILVVFAIFTKYRGTLAQNETNKHCSTWIKLWYDTLFIIVGQFWPRDRSQSSIFSLNLTYFNIIQRIFKKRTKILIKLPLWDNCYKSNWVKKCWFDFSPTIISGCHMKPHL